MGGIATASSATWHRDCIFRGPAQVRRSGHGLDTENEDDDEVRRSTHQVDAGSEETTKVPVLEEIRVALRKPFPERKRTWFTDAMALMEWSDAMSKGAYPSRGTSNPLYTPETVITIRLAGDELEAILTKTYITKTKKLRPKLEAMAAEGKPIELNIHEWSCIVSALCGAKGDKHGAAS